MSTGKKNAAEDKQNEEPGFVGPTMRFQGEVEKHLSISGEVAANS